MKPVIYITPEGSANYIPDCPEEPKCFDKPDCCFGKQCDWLAWKDALAEAKKNSIPFQDQEDIYILYCVTENIEKDTIYPIPDQYKVEIKRGNICLNCGEPDCVSLLCYDADGHCGYERVAVLSPVKRHEDKSKCTKPNCDCIEQAEKKAGGPVKSYPCLAGGFERADYKQSFKDSKLFQKPQEDKLISEPKDMKETALTTEEIEGLKTVGIVSANWYAVCVDKNTAPFALFDCLEYAEAYRKQFLATAIIEPWPMIVKDYRKPRNPQTNEK